MCPANIQQINEYKNMHLYNAQPSLRIWKPGDLILFHAGKLEVNRSIGVFCQCALAYLMLRSNILLTIPRLRDPNELYAVTDYRGL